jgi:hypothetical protein
MTFVLTVEISFIGTDSHCPLGALYKQELALSSPTSGGRSAGMIRSRTQATEFGFGTDNTGNAADLTHIDNTNRVVEERRRETRLSYQISHSSPASHCVALLVSSDRKWKFLIYSSANFYRMFSNNWFRLLPVCVACDICMSSHLLWAQLGAVMKTSAEGQTSFLQIRNGEFSLVVVEVQTGRSRVLHLMG